MDDGDHDKQIPTVSTKKMEKLTRILTLGKPKSAVRSRDGMASDGMCGTVRRFEDPTTRANKKKMIRFFYYLIERRLGNHNHRMGMVKAIERCGK
jgi:hypothetical protein